MTGTLKKLGATSPADPNNISSSRVIMFAAFAVFVAVVVYVAIMIGVGNPSVIVGADGTVTTTWAHYIGLIDETVDGAKWFVAPYVVGKGTEAYKAKKEAA